MGGQNFRIDGEIEHLKTIGAGAINRQLLPWMNNQTWPQEMAHHKKKP